MTRTAPKEEKPKSKKVKNARFHVGMTFVGNTVTSLDKDKHGADMDLTAAGIFARLPLGPDKIAHEYFVPFTNILFLELDLEA